MEQKNHAVGEQRERDTKGWSASEANELRSFFLGTRAMSRRQEILEPYQKVQRDLKLANFPIDGGATDGTFYKTIQAMWSAELGFGRSSPSAVSPVGSMPCYIAPGNGILAAQQANWTTLGYV